MPRSLLTRGVHSVLSLTPQRSEAEAYSSDSMTPESGPDKLLRGSYEARRPRPSGRDGSQTTPEPYMLATYQGFDKPTRLEDLVFELHTIFERIAHNWAWGAEKQLFWGGVHFRQLDVMPHSLSRSY